MPDIKFTQYLMPDGRKDPVLIDRPQPVYDKATQIVEAGYCLEIEMLQDYSTISMTIARDGDDHAIKVVPNGPEVPKAVDEMILAFDPSESGKANAPI